MRKVSILVLLGLIALAASTQATTLIRQDLGEQIDQAELIFAGTVVHMETAVTAKDGFPFTFVTFEVERTLKGDFPRGGSLTLRFGGGETKDDQTIIHGIPRFALDGRHVLFVAGNGQGVCPLVGWSQGKLDLRRHPETGEEILTDNDGWPLIGFADGAWRRADSQLTRDGFWKQEEPGVALVGSEGVEISGLPAADRSRNFVDAPTVKQLLPALASQVAKRRAEPTFQAPKAVPQAKVSDLPASLLPTKGGAQ
ncbi:MAG: hypothetical protein AAF604_12815 [Acidobacteriota bacterium]